MINWCETKTLSYHSKPALERAVAKAMTESIWFSVMPAPDNEWLLTVKDEAGILRLFDDEEVVAMGQWNPSDPWAMHPVYSVDEWYDEVLEYSTRRGYHDWVNARLAEDLEEDTCDKWDCSNSLLDNEGYDGYCGTCNDKDDEGTNEDDE